MNFDAWVRELVNLGVLVSTSAAIDRQVQNVLKRARTEPTDHCVEKHAMRAYLSHRHEGLDQDDGLIYPCDFGSALVSREVGLNHEELQSDLGDTGASQHLIDSSYNSTLYSTEKATSQFHTAGEGMISGDLVGLQDISVLNLDHQPNCPESVDHTRTVTTAKGLGPSL